MAAFAVPDPMGGARLRPVSPATGEEIESFAEFTAKEVDACVAKAEAAFRNWRGTPFKDRAERMRAVAEVLRRHAREYAETMAREMGKPVRDGAAEVEKCAKAGECCADD